MPTLQEFPFLVMLSLKYKNNFILGLVDQPILKERYWNNMSEAYLNGKKISTSNVNKLSDTIITVLTQICLKTFQT